MAKTVGPVPALPKTAETAYGADSSGLICAFAFGAADTALPLDSFAASAWLSMVRDKGSSEFLWLHFNLSQANSERWIRDHASLPEDFFETSREASGSTRVEQADDALLAVINDVVFEFSFDASQIATLWMFVSRNVVVSARFHPLRSVDRLRVAVKAGERFASPVSLLAHLLRDQAEVLQQIARDVTTQVDQIEDTLLAGRMSTKRSTLGALRRLLVRLRRLLAPEPGALFRLLSRPPTWFDDEDGTELRNATEEFAAVLADIAILQERTKLLQEEIVAHATEQTNRSVFLLTMVTVLALPINLTAGLFGMNVGGVPFNQDPDGFLIVAMILAVFTCIAGWLAFFKQRVGAL
jgi:zinc transporter